MSQMERVDLDSLVSSTHPYRRFHAFYSLFTRVRTRIGPTRLSQRFATMHAHLKAAGLMSEVCTFVDATHLIAKAALWEERDKARQQHIEKLNNEVLPKVAVDRKPGLAVKERRNLGMATRNTSVWICNPV